MSSNIPEYCKHSNAHKDVGGLKRLGFLVNEANTIGSEITILDVGCGTGSFTIPLGHGGHQVKGIDIDAASITLAQERNPYESVTFIEQGVEKEQEKYDLVLSIQVLEHLDDPLAVLKELFRCTKKKCIVTVPNGYGPTELMGKVWSFIRGTTRLKSKTKTNEGMFTANYNNPHVQFYTVGSMKKLVEEAGFTLKEVKHHMFLLGVFPFNQLFFHTPFKRVLERLDGWIADRLPHFMVSGFYFVLEK